MGLYREIDDRVFSDEQLAELEKEFNARGKRGAGAYALEDPLPEFDYWHSVMEKLERNKRWVYKKKKEDKLYILAHRKVPADILKITGGYLDDGRYSDTTVTVYDARKKTVVPDLPVFFEYGIGRYFEYIQYSVIQRFYLRSCFSDAEVYNGVFYEEREDRS